MESIKHIIEAKIESGALTQKPKWHFTLIHIGMWVGTLLAVVLLAYMVAFILLVGKEQHFTDLIMLGPQGIGKIFQYIPYPLVGIVILLIIFLFTLVHQYAFVYRHATFQTLGFLGIITVMIAVGLALLDKEMNFARLGEKRNIPIIRSIHTRYRQPSNEVTRGIIVGVEEGMLRIKDREGNVYWAPIPKEHEEEYIGQPVILFGPRQGNHITPFGIRPDKEMNPILAPAPLQ